MKADINEILRYMGQRAAAGDEVLALVKSCAGELSEDIRPRRAFAFFDISVRETVMLKGGLGFVSRSLAAHLKGCARAAIFAATLGARVDRKLVLYNKTDISRALAYHAAASAAIEEYCDEVEAEIKAAAGGGGYTARYSPGYGDFTLDNQADIIRLLAAEKRIGLTFSKGFLLAPSKSVTAVIGIKGDEKP